MKLYLILGVTKENAKQEKENCVELWAAESKEQLRDLIHPCEIPDSLIRDLRNIQPEGKHVLNRLEEIEKEGMDSCVKIPTTKKLPGLIFRGNSRSLLRFGYRIDYGKWSGYTGECSTITPNPGMVVKLTRNSNVTNEIKEKFSESNINSEKETTELLRKLLIT